MTFNFVGDKVANNLRNLKMTVLYRKGGTWAPVDVGRLVSGLKTEASSHPQHPECVILRGHYTKEETLKALMGGMAYTATLVTGVGSDQLPFEPSFF